MMIKFAIPVAQGKLSMHFGHSKEFAIIDMDNNILKTKQMLTPPPHKPGALPKWLSDLEVNVIIACKMGENALDLFKQKGITVMTGAPGLAPEDLVLQYQNKTLLPVNSVCNHSGCSHKKNKSEETK
jgi:ATP-binding protein involved in chromosome partitioning